MGLNEKIEEDIITEEKEVTKDFLRTDVNGRFPYGLYFYYFDSTLAHSAPMGEDYNNTIPFTHSSAIVSLVMTPYLTKEDVRYYEIEYDKDRFSYGELDNRQYNLPSDITPKVYRIRQLESPTHKPRFITKSLGFFNGFVPHTDIGGYRNWRNESKLYTYPYAYGMIYDGVSEPSIIKYELLANNGAEVKVKQAMNINMDYKLYIPGYKGDVSGNIEGFMSSSRELPTTSSQYLSWLATNKSQMDTQVKQAKTNTFLSSAKGAITGAVAGGLAGSKFGAWGIAGGAVIGAGASLFSPSTLAGHQAEQQALSTEQDMRNVPNVLNSKGSDLIMGLGESDDKLRLIRFRQTDEYMQKLGDFFAMYGYKQNRIMYINLRSRHYYNFIKTTNLNCAGDGIPKHHLESYKAIFNRGVTIWHKDRKNVEVGNYQYDNKEVD